jgi:hypothetical protein
MAAAGVARLMVVILSAWIQVYGGWERRALDLEVG